MIADPDELLQKVRELDAENEIVWLDRINANNSYALAIRREDHEKYGFENLSDLVAYWNEHPKEFVVGVGYEFYERPDGFFAFAEHYGLNIPNSQVSTMDDGLTYEDLANKKIDIAAAAFYAADGVVGSIPLPRRGGCSVLCCRRGSYSLICF